MTVTPHRRSREPTNNTLIAYLTGGGELPGGYTHLTECPEIRACIDAYAGPISAATIYLMRNADGGDRRVRNALSRRVDIDPCPDLGNRLTLMDWIVTTMLTNADGSAFVFPHLVGGQLTWLEPMPGAVILDDAFARRYQVRWQGTTFEPSDVLHFRMNSRPDSPWRGRGIRVSAWEIADSLAATESLKRSLSNPKYKPPLLVSVATDSPLSDPTERDNYREQYLSDDSGKPWIIPSDLMSVEVLKPLSLNDMAVASTIELDKRRTAALFGVPPFLLGIGSFSQAEYNLFINSKVEKLAAAIEKELTLKLCADPLEYFQFNRRRLYSYDLKTLIDIDLAMADRGYLNGDEVRVDAMMDPVGLTERVRLENYIPTDMAGMQKKLVGNADEGGDNAQS